MWTSIDISGQHFGKLIAQSVAYKHNRTYYWTCACSCGKSTIVPISKLRSGQTRSCGCLKMETTRSRATIHGLSRTKFYTWHKSMKSRCYNKNNPDYSNYGGRGIVVCDEWIDDPVAFVDWCISQEPIPKGYSLDRIDNDGPYAPWNCKFSSPKEQVHNRRKVMANLREKYKIAVLGLMEIDSGNESISARDVLEKVGHEFDFLLKETQS